MKTDWTHLDRYRVNGRELPCTSPGETCGQFVFPTENKAVTLCVLATNGDPLKECPSIGEGGDWEHVSVHARLHHGRPNARLRTPTWDEMCLVKSLFWTDEETVIQYHPPKADYVNEHPHVLHLWRPIFAKIPTPPKHCV